MNEGGPPIHDLMELLVALVRAKSVTGAAGEACEVACAWLRERGVRADNTEHGVVARVGHGEPAFLLISHLDTVPVGESWSFDPFCGEIVEGMLRGRGATDAKGSAAAMCAAMADLAADPSFRGSVILYLSSNEEGEVPAAIDALPRFGNLNAAIIGEPTSLSVGIAQGGLLVLDLVARSEQIHAAHSASPSAALLIAEDLCRVCAITFDGEDPLLGDVRITPTRLQAGVADNVTPPEARARFDIRTIPAWPHEKVLDRIRAACAHSLVEKVGVDWPPASTPLSHPLWEIAHSVAGRALSAGSTASDWAFLGHVPAVKIGPGDTLMSHRPNECVAVKDVREAARIYREIVLEYFRSLV